MPNPFAIIADRLTGYGAEIYQFVAGSGGWLALEAGWLWRLAVSAGWRWRLVDSGGWLALEVG